MSNNDSGTQNPTFAFSSHSPLEVALLSALAGSSLYGGTRLLRELNKALEPDKYPEDKKDLEIDVPVKQGEADEDPSLQNSPWNSSLIKLLSVALGVPAGFMATRAMVRGVEKERQDQEVQKANQAYLNTLKSFKTAMEAEPPTPIIDSFCEKLAENGFFDNWFSFGGEADSRRKQVFDGAIPSALGALPGADLAKTTGALAFLLGLGVTPYYLEKERNKQIKEEKRRVYPVDIDINEIK